MGCLNGKFLTSRTNPASASVTGRNNSDLYPKHDDSVNSSSPDEDKLLREQRLGNGTDKVNSGGGKIQGGSKKCKKSTNKEKNNSSSDDDYQASSSGLGVFSKITANGGGLFGRRLGSATSSSRNVDGTDGATPTSGQQQNGSILHSLGTLLENGGRSSSNSPRVSNASNQRSSENDNPDSPLTPDRLHKNFQERLLTSQVSRNNQKLTDSQLEFFRMLDEKIAQGREDDSWEARSANV